MSKNRAELKSYFVKNAIPTESQFAELIESSLSQVDDGVFKRGTDAVGVAAATGDEKRVLGLYATPTATGAEWTVCLNPKLTAAAAAGKPGFGINDGAGNSRLFISPTGQVGIGTNEPKVKLDVAGSVQCGHFRVASNAGVVDLEGTDHVYIQWFPKGAAAGRKGWIGYGGAGTDTLSITNEAAGNVVQINGPLLASDTINAGGYGPRNAKVNAGSMEVGSPDPIPSGANGGLIYFHHHNKVAHQLRYNMGTLYLEAAGNGYGSSNTPNLVVGGDVTVNGSVRSDGTVSTPGGIIFEGAVPHIQRDGALYRNTDGQCYLAVDDNLYIRIGSAVGAQFGAGGSFAVTGDVTVRGSRLKNAQGFGLLQTNATDYLRINPDQQFPTTAIYNSVATNGGLSVGDWSSLPGGHLNATGKITTGDFTVSGNIFQSGGRMHLTGGELLYLLHKDGVIIGREWGGSGNLSVQGTKNFQIDHPLDKGKDLVHAALEGPEAAVMYRGEAQLSAGQCVVVLPKYFEALARLEDRSVLLTPLVKDASAGPAQSTSALAASAIVGGKFTVYALDDCNPSQTFYWEAKGVRGDVDRLVVEPPRRRKAVGPAPKPHQPLAVKQHQD